MNFKTQQEEWSFPPIGGVSTPNNRLSFMADEEVREWVELTWPRQYGEPSNWQGLYRKHLGLDDTHGKVVLDYGSGFGFDALSFARTGNTVLLADIVPGNLGAAARVLLSHGHLPREIICLNAVPGDFQTAHEIDIFYSSGVLHHMSLADAQKVLTTAGVYASDDAEARLMLYSDQLWRVATGGPPPAIEDDQAGHPLFNKFVFYCDAVGYYAECYSDARVELLLQNTGWVLKSWDLIREDRGYGVAILEKKAGW